MFARLMKHNYAIIQYDEIFKEPRKIKTLFSQLSESEKQQREANESNFNRYTATHEPKKLVERKKFVLLQHRMKMYCFSLVYSDSPIITEMKIGLILKENQKLPKN